MSDTYHKSQDLDFNFFSKVKNLTSSLTDVYKTYVETDASGAKSVYRMAPHFKEVHSIQLNKKIKDELKNSYTGEKIHWYSNSGSSLSSLSSVCSRINYPTFFYLNYNNYSKNHDCLVMDYVKSITRNCKRQCIVCVDSFGLIDGCITVSETQNENNELKKKIVDSCGSRLTNNYNVGSISSGRYRLVLHLDKISEN